MTIRRSPTLDADALALFARKGREGGPDVPQAGEANGPKVRRILQVTSDFARVPLEQLRILDLGCGEGVYAIEAAMHGASVVALDARTERMRLGAECAARHGLTTVDFVQHDVRAITADTLGRFDIVWFLGLLYHLDVPDVFTVLETVRALCTRGVIIDTFVSESAREATEWRGRQYHGERYREHDDVDAPEVRRARVLRSVDNTFSFRLTRRSLARLLRDLGFTSVYEAMVPGEPGKPTNRVTLVAVVGAPLSLATYPWINGLNDEAIERRLRFGDGPPAS